MSNIARLRINLYVDCPNCEELIDLMQINADNDYVYSSVIFDPDRDSKWPDMNGMEVTCPECKREFVLHGCEY